VDVRDAARAFRLGLDADLTGFTAFNIVADDTLRTEPTEELVRTMLPTTELRGRLSGNASGWCTTRARALLGFVPEHSWRNERGN
jgi:nucleoside-diphosphate-sugar epimerase